MKYMHHPLNPEFENLTYPQYFEQYSITPSQPTISRPIYCDQLQNYVIKRTKEIIVRYRYLKLEDSELYFYQQLLLNYPARSETVYKPTANQTYCVAAQNVVGKTIHSELQITSTQTRFISKAFANKDFKTYLQKIDTLIIEEISMVSAKLLDFISNLFARLHNNAIAFGEINVIVVGFKENARRINQMICNLLPVPSNKFLLLQAIDNVDSTPWDTIHTS
ncbi:5081_t:CDS:2 [Gigaspora margarita]|uniref:ATP-dependent DNA helicase n=1 Tax=Gigaspora margarita TaxID=4874 RepID=A0ABN7W6H1_GIGMA|nr:5081_t:CDS:2 [Gigaspora margarita]